MNIKRDIVLRIRLAFLAILLFSLAVIYKIFYIQQINSSQWEKLANENLLQYRVVKATRGNIYSDNESLLATSIPFYRLAMDPTVPSDEVFRKGIDSLSLLLARHFKGRKEDYYKKINDARRNNKAYIIINREMINFQTQKMMSQWPIIREGKYKGGVLFEKIEKRFKPFSSLAARTIGFINENNTGVGLEKSYNNYLKGRDGEALFMRMGGGNWKPIHDESEIAAEPGVDILTTIDVNIQDVAEASLHRHLQKHNADYGCVVLMEVSTGEIKAISNLGKVAEGAYLENYNYAIAEQGLTDPGSTFKLASLIALFEDSDLRLEDSIYAERGRYKFFDRVMTDSHEGGYGWLDVQEAFEKSSNIAVSKLVVKHFGSNPQRYVDYIKGFGLAEKLGLQMQGEANPFVKTPANRSWSGVTLPWMSIGYELKLAPIHTLAFYNAIANQGKLIKPILVKEIRVADQVKEKFETEIIKEKICSDKTIEKARKMLEGVVENGTARNINNAIYKIAGKTGTAQKNKNGVYTKSYYTSFVGYFPADKPKYSCIVIIDSPKGFQQYGADVAAPVFKEIADKIYAADLDLHDKFEAVAASEQEAFPLIKAGYYDDLASLCNFFGISNHTRHDTDEEWVSAIPTNKSITWNARKIKETLVPDASGMVLRDALFLLENHGLKVRIHGTGRVVSQSLPPGARAVKGNTISIYLE
ncbi:MAG: transpeptidase family protein [Cytophagaceae bacterium]|jgi:cell division protein FtsI (penicillin-binding protein 3)|nr:transpeptidase family protein [Cytophagaceae bacterium]